MKIKEGFMLREMCGDYIVLAESLELIDFNKLISSERVGRLFVAGSGRP